MVARELGSGERTRTDWLSDLDAITRAPPEEQPALAAAFLPPFITFCLHGDRVLAPEHTISLRAMMAALAGIQSALGANASAADVLADSRCISLLEEAERLRDELSPVFALLRTAPPSEATKLIDRVDAAIERGMRLGRFPYRDEFAGPRRAAKARAARKQKSRCADERLRELEAGRPSASAEEIGRLYRDESAREGNESLPDLALPTLARKVRELRRRQSQKGRTG